jgi:hypothetical protein
MVQRRADRPEALRRSAPGRIERAVVMLTWLLTRLLAAGSLAMWAILDIKRDGRVSSVAFVKAAFGVIALLVATLRQVL